MLAFDQKNGLGHPGLVAGFIKPSQIDWEPFIHDSEQWCPDTEWMNVVNALIFI